MLCVSDEKVFANNFGSYSKNESSCFIVCCVIFILSPNLTIFCFSVLFFSFFIFFYFETIGLTQKIGLRYEKCSLIFLSIFSVVISIWLFCNWVLSRQKIFVRTITKVRRKYTKSIAFCVKSRSSFQDRLRQCTCDFTKPHYGVFEQQAIDS